MNSTTKHELKGVADVIRLIGGHETHGTLRLGMMQVSVECVCVNVYAVMQVCMWNVHVEKLCLWWSSRRYTKRCVSPGI